MQDSRNLVQPDALAKPTVDSATTTSITSYSSKWRPSTPPRPSRIPSALHSRASGELNVAASEVVPVAAIAQERPNPEIHKSIATEFLVLSCSADGKPLSALIDPGAAISIIRKEFLPTPTPPESRLKLKGVLPGTGTLYGPKMVDFRISKDSYKCPINESEIEEECILGLNFLQAYKCICDSTKRLLYIRSPTYKEIPLQTSPKARSVLFHTGSVYYTIRCSHVLDLQANESRTLDY